MTQMLLPEIPVVTVVVVLAVMLVNADL